MTLISLNYRLLPFGEESKTVLSIAGFVSFHIRLADEVKSVFIAEVIPAIVIRIVARAHRVDIVALHELNILNHHIKGNGASVFRRRLVAIHALKLNHLAINKDCVPDNLLILESDALHTDIIALTDNERIEVGRFCRPKFGIRKCRAGDVGRKCRDGLLACVIESRRPVSVNTREGDKGVLEVLRECRFDLEVPNAVLWHGPNRDIAKDARETEHILVFEVASVAPTIDLDGEQILARFHEGGNIELAWELRVFRIPHLLAVYPHIVGGIDSVKAKDDLAPFPIGRHLKLGAVAGNGVVVRLTTLAVENLREVRVLRVATVLIRIPPVGVAGRAKASHFDATGDINNAPLRVIKVNLPEVLHAQFRVASPRNLPVAIQQLLPRCRRLKSVRKCRVYIHERHRVSAGGKPIDGVNGRVFPLRRSNRHPREQCPHGPHQPLG